eukprot:scaffold100495_cov33-Phaeocystis_antarctica.AAC.1
MTPRDAAAACWAARRLLGAGCAVAPRTPTKIHERAQLCAARAAPALEAALERAALPFDLLPCLCALPPPPDRTESTEAVAGGISSGVTVGVAGGITDEVAEKVAAAADPEPGPCVTCGDAGTYWDGMVSSSSSGSSSSGSSR